MAHDESKSPGSVSRRSFLATSTASATALLWVGCGDEAPSEPGAASTSTSTTASGVGQGGAGGAGGDVAAGGQGGEPGQGGAGGTGPTPSCAETADNIEGPFYKEGAPSTASLFVEGMSGTRLLLRGRVLDMDCAPLAGALVDLWQADSEGAYDLAGFDLRGKVTTDARGNFAFDTVIPGHYLNGSQYRPAHLHTKVSAPGFELLTTQLYFEGDPYNDIDPFIHDSLIMPLTERADGSVVVDFDFVLVPA